MKEKRLSEAFNAWEELRQTPDTIIAYHSHLKTIIDEEARLDYAKHKGREEGKAEGRKEGIEEVKKEIILTGYRNGIELSTLALLTDYSVDEVEAIIEELKNHEE